MNIIKLVNEGKLRGEALAARLNGLPIGTRNMALSLSSVKNALGDATLSNTVNEVASAPAVKVATNEGATVGQSLGGVVRSADRKKPATVTEGFSFPKVDYSEGRIDLIGRDARLPQRRQDVVDAVNAENNAEKSSVLTLDENGNFVPKPSSVKRNDFFEDFLEKADHDQFIFPTLDADGKYTKGPGLKTDPFFDATKGRDDLYDMGKQLDFYEENYMVAEHGELFSQYNAKIEEIREQYRKNNYSNNNGFFTDAEIDEVFSSFKRMDPFDSKKEGQLALRPTRRTLPAPPAPPAPDLGFVGRYAPEDASANLEMGGPIFGSIEAGGLLGYGQAMGMGALVGGAASLATGGEFSEGAMMGGIAGGAIRGINSAIRANGSSLENMLYKNVFKDAPIPEGQAARVQAMRNMKEDDLGFVQKQARAMLMSENASLVTQSRGAIMAGAGLTGMMFTSPRKDKRRGFNKHRGNRI